MDVFYIVLLDALGHFYKSPVLGIAGHVTDQTEHILQAGRTPAEDTLGHDHVLVHRPDLIGVATRFR